MCVSVSCRILGSGPSVLDLKPPSRTMFVYEFGLVAEEFWHVRTTYGCTSFRASVILPRFN
jgi:hypothetical protein